MVSPAVDADDVLALAAAWRDAGRGVALATVVETWGSSPRPAGSQLAVDDHGAMEGSVSGGCVEAAVVDAAREVIRTGTPRVLEFGVPNERAWEVGLACGGRVKVLVERVEEHPVKRDLLVRLIAARAARHPVVVATEIAAGRQTLLLPSGERPPDVPATLWDAAAKALAEDRSGLAVVDGAEVFLHAHVPPPRLVVVGAVHAAQALAPMAALCGFSVVVVDPRAAFATPERFPGITLLPEWPDVALEALAPDRRTAVVTLTHDPKLDDPALATALRSPAFFIGALGSRKTHAARLRRLSEMDFGEEDLARIHGPVGLAIGARSAGEIAVSILAQLVAELRGAPG